MMKDGRFFVEYLIIACIVGTIVVYPNWIGAFVDSPDWFGNFILLYFVNMLMVFKINRMCGEIKREIKSIKGETVE